MKDIYLIIITLACLVLCLENTELRRSVESIENGYIELMERKMPGSDKLLGEYIRPGSMGIFSMRNKTVVCGELMASVERPEAAKPEAKPKAAQAQKP